MKHIFYTMLALLSLPAFAQESSIPVSPAYTADSLVNPSPRNWPLSGGNLYNQRYSPLSQINRDNVGNLKGVWRTHLNGSGLEPKYSAEAPPVVHDGVMYISTGANDVFALSVESGEILWQFAANINATITSVCCGWNNRGVAIGEGRVYTGLLDGRLVALDQKTGDIAWDIQAERWQEGFSITSAPVYFDDMVIVGFAGADRGTRGRIKAYDAKDGYLLWTFYTIPGPGEPGFESWPQDNDFWQYGGASLWQVPAVDPELDMVYFSTGNAGPDYTGRYRAGDNLYSASIVAIDAHTGEYRWHFQQVHHDIWDYDASNPVVLFDVVIDGRLRKGIVEVGKTGFAYILDRETGEPLIGIEEREVPQDPGQATAATQPYPLGESVIPQHLEIPPLGMELVNEGRIFTPFYGAEPVIVRPGIWGGASWPPSSYDPERALLYVCASDFAGSYTGGQDEIQEPDYSKAWLGGRSGPAVTARIGQFVAMDVRTNTAAWRVQWPDQCYSGSVATGGGLVFTGRNDGHLIALDSDNGRQLWTFQTGAGVNAPGTVFEHKGKQYVAVLSGGNALIGSARGDSVWLFGLDGTLNEAEPGDTPLVPAVAMAGEASTNVGEPDLANGESIYQQTCHQCHGDDGKGGHGGGAPLNALKDLLTVMTTVRDGRNDKMPALGAALSAEQIRDVSAYVLDAFTE
jgi:quinohemoprotein ethanol dehydrogenase